MGYVELSIVAPVFNEAAVLAELTRRCVEAARLTGLSFEVLLVDDASTDETAELVRNMEAPVRVLRLDKNCGQLGATLHGLRTARGNLRVVLDGDLQDPPEVVTRLVEALRGGEDAVFAVKQRRRDPLWFRCGRGVYRLLSRVPGARAVPSGAGSYCVLRGGLADEVAAMSPRWGNLANLVVLRCDRYGLVEYDKQERADGNSRVGFLGLVREALWSLALSGALTAWSFWLGVGLLALGALVPLLWLPFCIGGACALVTSLLLRRWSLRLRRGHAGSEAAR